MARCGARCALEAPFLCNTRACEGLGAWCHCTTSSLRSRVSTCPAQSIKARSEAHRWYIYDRVLAKACRRDHASQSLHRQVEHVLCVKPG